MVISEKTKISEIIKANNKAIDVIASINPNFIKLKNPILRKLLASHVTVEQAARIGKTTSKVILNKLKELDFEILFPKEKVDPDTSNKSTSRNIDHKNLKVLDVRPLLSSGIDPFAVIMKELKILPDNHSLLIINTFEPIPLIELLSKKGYESWTEVVSEQEYKTYFKQTIKPATQEAALEVNEDEFSWLLEKYNGMLKELDVRGMEMPYPMITILNELTELKEGTVLLVHHFKIPQLLLPQLDAQDYRYSFRQVSENWIQIIIYKDIQ